MPPSQNRTLQRAVDRGTKSSLIGILVNLGLALTKWIAGLIGHSFALVADGLESAADVISGVVVLFGLKLSVKPPDADHPYGYGKAEPIAAIVVGGFLLGAAGTIIYESLHQIRTPHPLPKPYTLVVLAGVLIVKELMFRYVGQVGDSIASTAVRSDAWHHRSDAITSAFAFCGISIALVGGPGWEAADDWAALCAGLVIIYNALKQTKPALLELTDSAPKDPNVESRVRAIAASQTGVIGLDKCHARKMGLSYYVDLHIIVSGQLTVREGHRIAHSVEDAILKSLPQVSEVLVHVEPEEELTSQGAAPRLQVSLVTKSRYVRRKFFSVMIDNYKAVEALDQAPPAPPGGLHSTFQPETILALSENKPKLLEELKSSLVLSLSSVRAFSN